MTDFDVHAQFELINRIIRARSFRECFLVDQEQLSKFHLRLVSKAIVEHRYGAIVAFRYYQLCVWRHLKYMINGRPGIPGRRLFLRLKQHWTNLVCRVIYVIFQMEISPFADLYPGINSVFTGLSITAGSIVKKGVLLNSRVSLVPSSKGSPTIDENVVLNTGCVIVGAITVGANSIVGANSVVINNVPAGVTVFGVPARIIFSISKQKRTETATV
jgi:serine acetyltransferase